jgi:hypothetical protein
LSRCLTTRNHQPPGCAYPAPKSNRAYAGINAALEGIKTGRTYYEPTTHGLEARIKERLDHWRTQWDAQK